MRVLRMVMAAAILLGAGAGAVSGGEPIQPPMQQPMQPGQAGGGFPGMGRAPGGEPVSPEAAQRMERVRNSERQRRLVADTDRLLALATELKQEVDKTNKDVMSVEVIKKAEEIEKLARSVKEKMKG